MSVLAWVGFLILLGYGIVALAAPVLAPYDPSAFVGSPLERPSPAHWLGTNDGGQDIASELIFGARASLLVAGLSALLAVVIALAVGALAGYAGGWTDVALMRFVDVMLVTPQVPLMIVVAAFLPPNVLTLVLVIGLLAWPLTARVVRAQVLTTRSRSYVAAARLFGGGASYVIARHLVPALGPILSASLIGLAGRAVLLEAGLAFLGIGDPTLKSWGGIMRAALNYNGIYFTPHWVWWLLPAGLCVSAVILALTLVGVGVEGWLDPRLDRHA